MYHQNANAKPTMMTRIVVDRICLPNLILPYGDSTEPTMFTVSARSLTHVDAVDHGFEEAVFAL